MEIPYRGGAPGTVDMELTRLIDFNQNRSTLCVLGEVLFDAVVDDLDELDRAEIHIIR